MAEISGTLTHDERVARAERHSRERALELATNAMRNAAAWEYLALAEKFRLYIQDGAV